MIKELNYKTKDFWKKKALNLIWERQFDEVFEFRKNNSHNWFLNGKINIYKNLIEKNLLINPNKIGISCITKNKKITEYSYKKIDVLVKKFENIILNFQSKKKINKIMIHASASEQSFVSMLTCSKLGIEFSVLFENLESEAILNRIIIFKPDLFLTRLQKKEFYRKNFNYLKKIKKNTELIFFENLNKKKKINVNYKIKKKYNVDSNKNFFTLFTSGSTGQPKGICHNVGGYLTYSLFTTKSQFGACKDSIILTASDAGWINGHTYAFFAPLLIGAETILIEDPFLLLDENFLIKILKKKKISILYLPVTIVRVMKSLFKRKSINKLSLKTIGSMGEHLAPDVGKWYSNYFSLKNKPIINTYFQTETGGIVFSPKYNEKIKISPHGSVGSIMPGIKFNPLKSKEKKEIMLTSPFPGLMKKVINSKKEHNKYFDKKNNFRMFDLATLYKKKVYVHGRIDDVINIRGHRIGCAEIEKIVLKNADITETAAVAVPHKLEGSVIILFVQTKKINLDNKINKMILSNFGSFAIPKKIYYLSELPKTRSGKILRRLLRNLYERKNKIGDISTIKNKKIINEIKKKIND